MNTIARVYFIDAETGKELVDHPLNGSAFNASSKLDVELADGRIVTALDFDRPVLQKRWFGPDCEFNDIIPLGG